MPITWKGRGGNFVQNGWPVVKSLHGYAKSLYSSYSSPPTIRRPGEEGEKKEPNIEGPQKISTYLLLAVLEICLIVLYLIAQDNQQNEKYRM